MKKITNFKNPLLILSLCLALFVSCSDDESETLLVESERIIGTWTIKESVVLGITIPGDDSSLTFSACSTTCNGVDYEATNETSGTFTYEFKNEFKTLSIDDDDSDLGGSYTGDWSVSKFTNNSLTLSTQSILGEVSFTFTK